MSWPASRCPGRRLSTWQMIAASCPTALGALCGQLTFRLAWYRTVVTAAELLQPLDLACGTLFQSSCAIQTSPTDCSHDNWRDTFFGKHEHGALWLLICGALEKHLFTYLPTFVPHGILIYLQQKKQYNATLQAAVRQRGDGRFRTCERQNVERLTRPWCQRSVWSEICRRLYRCKRSSAALCWRYTMSWLSVHARTVNTVNKYRLITESTQTNCQIKLQWRH